MRRRAPTELRLVAYPILIGHAGLFFVGGVQPRERLSRFVFMMRKFLTLVLVAAALTGVESMAVAAGGPGAATGQQRYTVTLLTGDVVTVVTRQSGCPLVTVKPAKPSGMQLRKCTPDGHMRVVPKEVAPLLGTVLDDALFDVTTLVREGYDDASTKELPLIVRSEAGLKTGLALSSIGAVAVRQSKADGLAFLKSLPKQKDGGKGPLVRLDRRVRVTSAAPPSRLDANLTQVGAPQAWEAGHTGRGVNVAVLDTGADFTHPDLTGQVVERADFTVKDGDAVDRYGHGTHVAATIAGTGAAAAGRRKGVAPDAKLLVGKVIDDSGFGSESQVIAGMEWAAARAKVVNMSLGGFEQSDGTDPLSQALDSLTAKHGTLFVVASGNEGDGWISSPAAAKEALTVGAVDRDDKLAWFSGRGPVINTRAAKPELVAPGVDIVAARAAGTAMGTPVDAHYTSASGTSMATPHVAGGAAILAQLHPDWTARQLKAGLVGAVDPLGGDVYEHGSGRLNVARKAVSGQAIVHLGDSGNETKLAYTQPVQLSVRATDRHGTPTPAGAVTLDGSTLRVDRSRLQPGVYSAVVTAAPKATTPVTFFVAPPMYELTLNATAPPNTVDAYTLISLVNLDDPVIFQELIGISHGAGPITRSVPAGRYSIMASIFDFEVNIMALAGDPDVAVTADTSFVIDGANAKSVSGKVEGVATVANSKGITFEQTGKRGFTWGDFAFAWGEDARRDTVFAAPNPGAGIGTFETFVSFSLVSPDVEPSPFLYDLVRANGNRIPDDLAYRFETAGLARIDQRFHLLDRDDETYVWHKRYGYSPSGGFILENDTRDLPAHRIDYVTPGVRYVDEAFYNGGVGYGVVLHGTFETYAPRSRQEKIWVRQPLRPDWYGLADGSTSGCEPRPITRTRGYLHVELVDLTDQHDRFDCLGFGDAWTFLTKRKLTLHRNGQLVGEQAESFGMFPMSPSMATYKLTYDLDATALLPVSTRVTTSWTFRSKEGMPIRLHSIDYALPLDTNNHPTDGRATFTIRNAQHRISSFVLYTSVDDGVTWQRVDVRREGSAEFSAQLPKSGRPVSLRVATDGLEQTIISAYR